MAFAVHVAIAEVTLPGAFHEAFGLPLRGLVVVAVHEIEHAPPDHFGTGVAEHALERRIRVEQHPVGVDHAQGVGHQVDELGERWQDGSHSAL